METAWNDRFDRMVRELYSAALSDVLDEMGYRDRVVSPSLGIVPLDGAWVTAGRAKTLFNEYSTVEEDPYGLAIKGLDELQANQVLVAGGSVGEIGIMGELSAHRIIQRGGRGVIVNGYTRDSRHLARLGFPVFCRGASPIDSTGRSRVTAIDVPIPFGSISIHPGQIVFADADGVVAIPQEREEEIIDTALERVGEENVVRSELREGATFREVWERYHIL